jgi:lysozyme family protein
MHKNFKTALNLTLKFEGGWVDNIHDPGGSTNMGITMKTLARYRNHPVSASDLRMLARDEVEDLYLNLYWHPLSANELPSGIDLALFDYAVNSGQTAAIRALQTALGVQVDGILGSDTLKVLVSTDQSALIHKVSNQRLDFLRRLGTFRWFGVGWTTRVKAIELEAMRLATSKSTALTDTNHR